MLKLNNDVANKKIIQIKILYIALRFNKLNKDVANKKIFHKKIKNKFYNEFLDFM